MPTPKNPQDNLTIDQLVANTRELLEKRFRQAYLLRDEDGVLQIAFLHKVETNEYGELTASTKIGFGKKIKDSVEHTVDTTQLKLGLEKGVADESE